MAKLDLDPITGDHVREFVEGHSDFAFELSVHHQLTTLGFTCDHGGTYSDPVTEKIRQFDIRATRTDQTQWLLPHEQVRLAVECKRIGEHFPLVIHTVPRTFNECTHDILVSVDPEKFSLSEQEEEVTVPAFVPSAIGRSVRGQFSLYSEGEAVGKSCAQVGRDRSGGIYSTDSEVFSKWTQAISSAQALADQVCDEGRRSIYRGALSVLVLPVLVVPNDRLWLVGFDADGSLKVPPKRINRCPYWIDSTFECGDQLTGFSYNLSHLEFVTSDGLAGLVRELMDESMRDSYFARRDVRRLLGLEIGMSPGWT